MEMQEMAKKTALLFLLCSLMTMALPKALTAQQQQQRQGHAVIPFDFWVGGEHLPAGDYIIEHIESTSYFLFRNTNGNTLAQAYTVPLDGDPPNDGQYKLVFKIKDGKHLLYGGWGPFGRRVLSSESAEPALAERNRVDVPVTYH